MQKSFKIVVFTPVWGRHDVLEIWHKGVERIKAFWPEKIEIIPFCMVSNDEDEAIIKGYGYQYVRCENKPLGAKHNAGLEALRNIEFDYILQLGSDDLITNEYLEYALAAMNKSIDVFGVDRLYFTEIGTDQACKFILTTQANELIGAGRFISHRVIKLLDYELWPYDINRGLDMTSQANMSMYEAFPKVISTENICVLDVKSNTNIWSYETFGDNFPKVHIDQVKALFPEI